VTTGGFTDTGTFTGTDITGTCAYTGRTDASFTGITGCTGTPADGAAISGSSTQSAQAGGKADNKTSTADGNQN